MTNTNKPSDTPLVFDSYIVPADLGGFTCIAGLVGDWFGYNIYVNTGWQFQNLLWCHKVDSGLHVKRDDSDGKNRAVFYKSSIGFDSRDDALRAGVDYLVSIGAVWYR